ncbi:MAG: lipoate--protein ligase family protein [Candidatus Thorarchaeota archaeon]|nr:lipoate--protein ligase family protein [Candidatus Thorarchaeota archaeon]
MSWRLLDNEESDIYRNLALEESLARTNAGAVDKTNTVRFWKSEPSVVLGRFQCVHEEVNIEFCRNNDISIARRFTGGGTVFHDEGNLNISFCLDQSESFVSRTLRELYWNFIGTLAKGLRSIGIGASYDPNRSCIRINGRKITGTAGWLKQGVSFIHGTLLLSANLETLRRALSPPPNQTVYLRDGRSIRCKESKKDVVTTIAKEFESPPTEDKIKQAIIDSIATFTGAEIVEDSFTEKEEAMANSLYHTRYKRTEWNLGTLTERKAKKQ